MNAGAALPPRYSDPSLLHQANAPPRLSEIRVPQAIVAVAALLAANCALAVLWPGPHSAIAALLLFAAFALLLFLANPGALVLLLPFVLIYVSSLASMISIEAGAFMKEIGRYGNASPASAAFAVCNAVFIATAAGLHLRLLQRRPLVPAPTSQRPFVLAWGGLAIGLFIVLYLTQAGLRSGFPLLSSTDRFEYRRLSADVLTLNFLNLKFVIGALLGTGAAFAGNRLQRVGHHLTFSAYLLVSFLFGDKFFIVLVAAAAYGMPLLLKAPAAIRGQLRRHVGTALLPVACAFAVTVFIYSDYGALGVDATLKRLGERVAGQGQLWFAAVEDFSRLLRLDVDALQLNVRNLFANPAADFAFSHRIAAFFFVERYAPSAMYHSVLTGAGMVTPTLVFEAYALVMLGYVGLFVALVVSGVVAGAMATWLARAFMTGNPFNVLLPAYAFAQLMVLMSQGTLYSLLGLSAFKAYAAFFVLQLVMAELAKPRVTRPVRTA